MKFPLFLFLSAIAFAQSGSLKYQTFSQGGTGAVIRDAASKAADTVSVKDYGAMGDGTHDDTTAIQAALDASLAVTIPRGTYFISAPLKYRNGHVITGAGDQATIILNGANNHAFTKQASGFTRLVMRDLQIADNISDTRTTGAGVDMDNAGTGGGMQLSNVRINGHYNSVAAREIIVSELHYVRANGAKADCFLITSSSTSVTLTATYAASCGGNGYTISGSTYYVTLNGTAADGSHGDGYYLDTSSFVTLNSPGAEGNTGNGLHILNSYGLVANAPFLTGSGQSGALIEGGRNITLSGGEASICSEYGVRVVASGTTSPTGITLLGMYVGGNTLDQISDPTGAVTHLADTGSYYHAFTHGVIPQADAAYPLGVPSNRWLDGYFSGTINASAINTSTVPNNNQIALRGGSSQLTPLLNLWRSSTTLGSMSGLAQFHQGIDTDQYGQIGFGYYDTDSYAPGIIGFKATVGTGHTKGSIIFATRDSTSDIAPTARAEIDSAGGFTLYGLSGSGPRPVCASAAGVVSADCTGAAWDGTNLVLTTGDQSIAGTKSFTDTVRLASGAGGGYLQSMSPDRLSLRGGHYYTGSAWQAVGTTASGVDFYGGGAHFFFNTGLTPGSTYTPTERITFSSAGAITATGFSGPLTGNASTASALAANGSNCTAGNYPLGVDAAGNAESCTPVPVTSVAGRTGAITLSSSDLSDSSNFVSTSGDQSIAGTKSFTGTVRLASGAGGGYLQSMSPDRLSLRGGHYYTGSAWQAVGTTASGVDFYGGGAHFFFNTGLTPGSTYTPTERITFSSAGAITATGFSGPLTGNASTASALAANGSNCATGNYPLGVDAAGNAESCTPIPVMSVAGRTGAITLSAADLSDGGYLMRTSGGTFTGPVSFNGATFSGTVTAPSGSAGTSTTLSCPAGQYIKSITVSGGLVTAVACGT